LATLGFSTVDQKALLRTANKKIDEEIENGIARGDKVREIAEALGFSVANVYKRMKHVV